jgi:hypothetical protein
LIFEFCSWRELVLHANVVCQIWHRTPKVTPAWLGMYPKEFLGAAASLRPDRVRSLDLTPATWKPQKRAPVWRVTAALAQCTRLQTLSLSLAGFYQEAETAQLFVDAVRSHALIQLTFDADTRWADSSALCFNANFESLHELSLCNQYLDNKSLATLRNLRVLKTQYCELARDFLPSGLVSFTSVRDWCVPSRDLLISCMQLQELVVLEPHNLEFSWPVSLIVELCARSHVLVDLSMDSYWFSADLHLLAESLCALCPTLRHVCLEAKRREHTNCVRLELTR